MILIVVIIAGAVFSYFGLKPHPEVARYSMIDPEMDGFGILRINPDDKGSEEFIKFFAQRIEKSSGSESEPVATSSEADSGRAKVVGVLVKYSKNLLSQIIQPEVLMYTKYNPETADESVLISAPLKNRMAWMLVRQFIKENIAKEPVSTSGVAEIYPLHVSETGTSTVLSLDPTEIIISDSQKLMTKGVAYAKEVGRSETPSDDLQWFVDQLALDEPPEGEELAVALVNEESRITNMIFVFEDFVGISGISDRVAASLAAKQLTFSDISGMKLTADLVSADVVNGQLTLYCPSADAAVKLAAMFTEVLPRLSSDDAATMFKLKGTAAARGMTVIIDLELAGLKAWIESLFPVVAQPVAEAATPAA